jgi:transposase InsO family protein
MPTSLSLEALRQLAVRRVQAGESPAAVAHALRRSRRWVYKWVTRARAGEAAWAASQPRAPHHQAQTTPAAVRLVRLELYNAGLLCGAQNIQWRLEELAVTPLPAVRTINRILGREGLTHRRTGRYVPKGKVYPRLPAERPNQVHQMDYLGPCYLAGGGRFYSLNTMDVATNRCAAEPVTARAGQGTVDAVWATWTRLGLPDHVQADNEMVFYGSPAHPRGMGLLIRLCLGQGIEPWFLPFGEPWWNGVVERFNGHYRAKFLARVHVPAPPALWPASLAFEARHNSRYRYTKLGGRTPLAALAAAAGPLRFPSTPTAPRVPLPKPEAGCYHVVRFVRHEGQLDVFGERFPLPPEAQYEYVVGTVDVATQRLRVALGADPIAEFPYRLR